VESFFGTNIMVFVGTGQNAKYPKNKLIFWNDYSQEPCAEIEYIDEVIACKLRKDLVSVILKHRVSIHNFKDLSLFDQIETSPNPHGVCAMVE